LLALGTLSITAFSSILIGESPTIDLLLMAYLFSYGAYSMNRSSEIGQDMVSNPSRTTYLQRRKKYLPAITVACFSFGYVLAALRSVPFFLALLVPLILSALYSIGSKKFVRLIGVKRFKEKLLLKNIVISLGWSLVPILVGLYFRQLGTVLLLLVPFIFLRLFVNTVFFDARDIVGDNLNGVRTLPTVYGLHKSYTIMSILDFSSAIYISLLIVLSVLPVYSVIILGLPLYSMIYRWLALRDYALIDIMCDVVGDGEYVLWGALLFLGRTFI